MAAIINPNDSILRTIAKLVDADGLEGTDEFFDTDLMVHINTAIFELYQVGVGDRGFTITSENETWENYLKEDLPVLSAVKDYIYIYVKLIFDPPQSSSVQTAMQSTADRLLYRIREQLECTSTL